MSNEVLFSTEVIIYLFSQSIVFLLQLFALFYVYQIIRYWDFNSTSTKQYKLEKKSYLVMLIILFSLITKMVLIPYFAYTIDELSNIVPGAMCAAGVININEYGMPLLVLKIIIVFFISMWLIVNSEDLKAKDYPFIRRKLYLFVFVFMLVCIEYALDILYFTNMPLDIPVLCCSVIYGAASTNNALPFGLDIKMLLILFYLMYVLTLMTSLMKNGLLTFLVNALFAPIAYFAVIYFFGTYIYELPTHQCPFCMLQHEYHYVGYLVWATLFLGLFFGLSSFWLKYLLKKEMSSTYTYSIIFNTLFVALCSAYVVIFYLKNGVFL